jgi:hypothetical protein
MAKHKVSELEGALLDAAVAKAEGLRFALESYQTNPPRPAACWLRDEQGRPLFTHGLYAPSANWAHGGPFIELKEIALDPIEDSKDWEAELWSQGRSFKATGPTPLIAAMRAYVASRFGDEVELP